MATQYNTALINMLLAPPHFHFGLNNSIPGFLCQFLAGELPAFEGDNGFCVFKSNAIAYYVSPEELQESIPEAAAQVAQG